jgi:hypothetical protein
MSYTTFGWQTLSCGESATHLPDYRRLEKRLFGFQKVHKVFRLEFPPPYSVIAFFIGSKTNGLLGYPQYKKNSAEI